MSAPDADFRSSSKSDHFLLYKFARGIRSDRKNNSTHQYKPIALKPPNAHMPQITEAKKPPYGTIMSFQYGVEGYRQGEECRTAAVETINRSIPVKPAIYFLWKRKITAVIKTQTNAPSQPAVQPIFSPRLLFTSHPLFPQVFTAAHGFAS